LLPPIREEVSFSKEPSCMPARSSHRCHPIRKKPVGVLRVATMRRLHRIRKIPLVESTHCCHCNSLRQSATHCSTLQHTATHCNTLQHTATHYNTLQHTATHCNTLQHTATHRNTLQHIATHCNILSGSLHFVGTLYKKRRRVRHSLGRGHHRKTNVLQCVAMCCSVLQCVAVPIEASCTEEP